MWRTIGHDKAINNLHRSLREGRLSHAYLLAGPRQVGKMTLALELAQAVNCLEPERPCGECVQCSRIGRGLHTDVRIVGLDTEASRVLISIDQVREVQREASLKPFEGRSRVFIFDGAEHLSEEAANSLLKTLEEPPDQVVLILLASDLGVLLPTLVSRCQVLGLRPVAATVVAEWLQAQHGADSSMAQEIARLAGGKPGWAVNAVSDPEILRKLDDQVSSIAALVTGSLEERFSYAAKLASSVGRGQEARHGDLSLWLGWWRDVLLVKAGLPELAHHRSGTEAVKAAARALTLPEVTRAVNAVQDAIGYFQRNVNPRLALEDLMLALPRPHGPEQ